MGYRSIFAQDSDLEFNLDVNSETIAIPKIFKPNIDLSGRGFHHQNTWPQGLAVKEVLSLWHKDMGFSGIYRLQYNLWEISQLNKDKTSQEELLRNYEAVMKDVTLCGGVVILNIFGTPEGLGRVLDKKSSPLDLKALKKIIKSRIEELSCHKRYSIWYEVWSAPDLDDFFLGRKQEYLNLYRSVAEAINELEEEYKIHIPLGGPSSSWWFQNFNGNTAVNPEHSLIYELIKFCYHYRLPLDFISWHSYTTDPFVEQGTTIYKKSIVSLIRAWLGYFNFDRNTPLIIDEWNFDSGSNVLAERFDKSYISASYIPSRIKNMYEAGIDYQLYFSLEDFQNNKENVTRNTGLFWFDTGPSQYQGGYKNSYNALRMLESLGDRLFLSSLKIKDEFVGVLAGKGKDYIAILVYNYIDPDIAMNYLSRGIVELNNAGRKSLLNIVNSERLNKIMSGHLEIRGLRLSNKTKTLLDKARELKLRADKALALSRNMKIGLKGLKGNYLYQRYLIDSSSGLSSELSPKEEKELVLDNPYQEALEIKPYSLNLIILKPKPPEPEPKPEAEETPKPAAEPVDHASNTKQ
jgi:hypothetical protein